MRKALYTLTVILLIGAVIVGCGKKENPFEPITSSYNVSGSLISNRGPKVVSCTDLSGNQVIYHTPAYDEIGIVFDSDMEPSTITTSTVKLQNVENMTAPITYTVTYDAKTKKAIIKITGVWEDSKSYLVTVTTGAKDKRGNTIDGNGNDNNKDPQDSYHQQFWGATSAVQYYNFRGPRAGVYPANNTLAFALTDSIRITIWDDQIAPYDSIDPATLIASNFSLTTEAGVNVPLPTISVTEVTTPQRVYLVKFRPLGLTEATNYIFTVKTGIKDIHGNTLDGDDDNLSERDSEDEVVVRFRTFDPYPTGLHLIVREAYYTDNNNTLIINFTRKMNVASMNATTIKLYDNNDATGYIPGTIRVLPDSMGVSYTLENRPRPLGTDYLWVSRAVRDTGGLMLDQNGNNFGGEPANEANGYVSDDFINGTTLYAFPYTASIVRCIFDDNVENGSNGWSAQRLWHRSTRRASATWGGSYSWHCADISDSSYSIPYPGPATTAVNDTLFLPSMNCITYTNGLRIVYDWWSRTDGAADATRLIYSIDNGTNWNLVNGGAVYSGNQSNWTTGTWYNCNPGIGQIVRFAFAFNTDAAGNAYPSEGFYLDNIRVYAW